MWQDNLTTAYIRNMKLILACMFSVLAAMLLFTIGYALAPEFAVAGPAVRIGVLMTIGLTVALAFALWSVKSVPRYPQTPLEHHQERVERAVVKEWGRAISWLRETIATAEDTSIEVIQIHRSRFDKGIENPLRQITLLAMHNRLCHLSRSVADLCQRGHAEAALMVWRSVFEIEVNMGYVSQYETDKRAERFKDWGSLS